MGAIPRRRLSAFYFFYFALLGAWLPYWPLYLSDLGYGAAAIGVLAGIMQGARVLAPGVWGWLADRSGARMRVIRAGALAALAIFSAIFLRSDFTALALIVAGYSFFWNAVLAQFEVITLSHLQGAYQRYSRVRLWGSLGFIAAVAGLGFLFEVWSVRRLPLVLWLLLAGIFAATLSVREGPALRAPAPAGGRGLWAILRRPEVLGFLAVSFLLQVAHAPYYTFFSVYLRDYHYSAGATGLLWALGVAAEVLLFLNMHRVLRRFALRRIMLVSLLLTALRWLMIAAGAAHLPLLLAAQCLHAASFAAYHAVAIELVRRLFAGGYEGRGMALYSGLCFGGGSALGAVGSGLLWSLSRSGSFVAAAAVALLAWWIGRRWVHLPAAE